MAEKRKEMDEKDLVLTFPEIRAPGWLQGFVDFIREQGVVGLAIGLIFGVASKSVIDSLVGNIFNPLIGLLYGGGDFSSKYWCLKSTHGNCIDKLGYGHFFNDFISFIIIAFVVYFVVKKLKLDKLDNKTAKDTVDD